MDLRDLWRPGSTVTPRFVVLLVGQLSPDSAFSASLRGGGDMRAWTPLMHMQAAVVNLLFAANRQRAGKKTKEPLVKPPSQRRPAVRRLTVAEIARRPGALVAD